MSKLFLLPWAEDLAYDYNKHHNSVGCCCHNGSAPCVDCTHEGNPLNLENTPEAWGTESEYLLATVSDVLNHQIQEIVARHIKEYNTTWLSNLKP